MEENCSRLHFLVSQIHEMHGLEPPPVPTLLFQSNPSLTVPTTIATASSEVVTTNVTTTSTTTDRIGTSNTDQAVDVGNKKQRCEDPTTNATLVAETLIGTHNDSMKKNADGTEHILAASALCQLAGPEDGSGGGGSSLPSANNSVVELLLQDPITATNGTTTNTTMNLGDDPSMNSNVVMPGISEDHQQQLEQPEESWSTAV
jgi:hypothetical protein